MIAKANLGWLRGLGTVGGYIADFVTIATSVGITVSLLLAAVIGFWSGALAWVQHAYVYVPAAAFIFCLWTYIGISTIANRRRPQIVKLVHEYAYSIIPEGVSMGFGYIGPNLTNAGEEALVIQYNFRNVSAGPLRVVVAEYRIVLDGRTNDDQPIELIFPRMGGKQIRTGGILRDKSKQNLNGTASIKLHYGPLDGELARVYTLRTALQVGFDAAGTVAMPVDHIVEEKDLPYVSR